MNNEQRAILFVLGACLLWGCGYPFWKYILEEIGYLHMVALATPGSAILLFILGRLRPSELYRTLIQHSLHVLGVAVFGGVLGSILVFYALEHLSTGVTVVLEKLQPIFTILLASIFLGERSTLRALIYGILAIVCSVIIAFPAEDGVSISSMEIRPLLAGIGCAISYAIATVFARGGALRGVPSVHNAFFRMALSGSFFLSTFLVLRGPHQLFAISLPSAGLLFLLVCGPYSLAFYLYFRGLVHLKAGVANLFELSVPVVALLLSTVVIGEVYSTRQLVFVPIFIACTWAVIRNR